MLCRNNEVDVDDLEDDDSEPELMMVIICYTI